MAGDPASHDFEIFQGASFDKALLWKDFTDTPIDLTGYTARMQVRRDYARDSDELLLLTTENGRILLDTGLPDFNIRLLIDAATTAALPAIPGDFIWYYDLEMVNGSDVRRLLMGKFKVSLEITR